LVLIFVFLFVLLAVSALAPPARNHWTFVSFFFFVADLLVFGWLFFAEFFVFIGYLLGPLCGVMVPAIWEVDHIGALKHRSPDKANSASSAYAALAGDIF
jgi:hypothetical protein